MSQNESILDVFENKKRLLKENEKILLENGKIEKALEKATELFNCSSELELRKRIETNKIIEYPESDETLAEV